MLVWWDKIGFGECAMGVGYLGLLLHALPCESEDLHLAGG